MKCGAEINERLEDGQKPERASEDRWKQREWKEGERGEKIKAKRESLSNRTSRLCARRARDVISHHEIV